MAIYNTSFAGVVVNLLTGAGNFAHAQGDKLVSVENFIGSAHRDIVTGSTLDNHILGGGDVDQLLGGAGKDTLVGGDGNDVLTGGVSPDILNGGNGLDWASYEGSNAAVKVSLITNSGSGGHAEGDKLSLIENIIGAGLSDTLAGNALSNYLIGENGNDTLIGGAGNDTLSSGNGLDVIGFAAAYDFDILTSFADDADTLRLDNNLWSGAKTVSQVLADHAAQFSADTVQFIFSGGDVLRVSNPGLTIAALQNDIVIV